MVRIPAAYLHSYQGFLPWICRSPLSYRPSGPRRYLCCPWDGYPWYFLFRPCQRSRKTRNGHTLLSKLCRDRGISERELQVRWSADHHGCRRCSEDWWRHLKIIPPRRIFPGRVQDLRTVASAGFCLSHWLSTGNVRILHLPHWLLIRDIHIFYEFSPGFPHSYLQKRGIYPLKSPF